MNKKNICMLGICGAGMAPLAIYLSQYGYTIYGWDDHQNSKIKDLLIANKIVFLPEKLLPSKCDFIIRSTAVDDKIDSICQEAAKYNIPIFQRGQFFAKSCENKKLIAIVGSHGKTSVTANCVEILKHNNISFDYMVGGFFKNNSIAAAAYSENSEYIVAEIDESDRTIENFSPEYTIALNYDDDHIGNYGNKDNFLKTFEELFQRTKTGIFVPQSDEVFSKMAFKFGEKYIPITKLDPLDFSERNKNIAKYCLEKIFNRQFSFPPKMVGVQRRSDLMLQTENLTVINDYAHHPTEINALLKFAKKHYPDHQLNIVFQPHRLSRTKQYFMEFAKELEEFDKTFIVELYSAFEEPIVGVSSMLVFDNIRNPNKEYLSLADFNYKMHGVFSELLTSKEKQLIMFVGAGNILSHAKKLMTEISFAESENLLKKSNIFHEHLADITNLFSIRVASSARLYVEPASIDELAIIRKICQDYKLKMIVVGNGTKILPPDGIINAMVVRLKSDNWKKMKWVDDNTIYCSSGSELKKVCEMVAERKFCGIEKLMFIPCCIGGAIFMNAGSHGQSISDNLISITTMDETGNTHTIDKSKIEFEYRKSQIPDGHIILGATFRFEQHAEAEYFETSSKQLMAWRKSRQPRGSNFGSVFKNGLDFHAGELIDKTGLKGKSINNAQISEDHANFIINNGHAKSSDIEKLIDRARYEVFNSFEKYLETEVIIIRN